MLRIVVFLAALLFATSANARSAYFTVEIEGLSDNNNKSEYIKIYFVQLEDGKLLISSPVGSLSARADRSDEMKGLVFPSNGGKKCIKFSPPKKARLEAGEKSRGFCASVKARGVGDYSVSVTERWDLDVKGGFEESAQFSLKIVNNTCKFSFGNMTSRDTLKPSGGTAVTATHRVKSLRKASCKAESSVALKLERLFNK